MSNDQYARTGRTMFILAWLIFFIFLFLFFHYYGQENEPRYRIQQGQLILDADEQGHYRMPGHINDRPVHFLLDTGASLVAVPQTLANQLHLTGRYPVRIQTAGGNITGMLTRLDKLEFGKFTLKNVKAVIIPGDRDKMVLMGMNVLNQFNMIQKNKQLIIKH
ncbi:TIGR02281 family clan AA aspartic protease [Legionella israelensis]|uniref:TIGR02281 family clan AA aspartic protease n=1 Tax=Legionella israelensis TaxID=454 RepID=A0AAX1EHZ5_9GAMM|nr:retropepsin-like aspartic protease [Legionella israelensis]QBR84585.1 TIGR02281 family clan AA aspartic protease [Legionella israelensis]QDP72295.1 TIGR02281 family clan AA aspartic protease [Legionella israelensis]